MIELRRATFNRDAENLFRWKNDPDVRKNSILTEEPISYIDHTIWLKKHLVDPNSEIYIIVNNGVDVGDIRFETGVNEVEIALKLDPKHRGRGFGYWAVQIAGTEIQARKQRDLVARIVDGNIPSFRTFLKAGFLMEQYVPGKGKGYYILRKKTQ